MSNPKLQHIYYCSCDAYKAAVTLIDPPYPIRPWERLQAAFYCIESLLAIPLSSMSFWWVWEGEACGQLHFGARLWHPSSWLGWYRTQLMGDQCGCALYWPYFGADEKR